VKKSALFLSLVIVAGIFLVVWRLGGDSDASTDIDTAAQPQADLTPESAPSGPAASVAAGEAESLLQQGTAAWQRGEREAAEKAFEDLMKRFPSQPAGARGAVKLAAVYRKDGNLYEARNALSRALEGIPEGSEREDVVAQLDRLNGELVFSRKETPASITYTVKSGDALARIAKAHGITAEFIKRINYLTSDMIHVGDRLKLLQGPFDVVIEKSKFRLMVYRAGIFIKEYHIGLGKDGSTPEGEFAVVNKLVNPEWDPPGPEYAAADDPDNPLGTRWIGFRDHYGIHGTVQPETIGIEDSRGCVRLLNRDAEELFDLVVHGSKVVVKP